MKAPCYDRATRTDCPDRKPGCHDKCARWYLYLMQREKEYEARRKMAMCDEVLFEEIKSMKKRRSK